MILVIEIIKRMRGVKGREKNIMVSNKNKIIQSKLKDKEIEELKEELQQANIDKEDYFIAAEELAKQVVILKKQLDERGLDG